MNTALIYIFLPASLMVVLVPLSRFTKSSYVVGVLTAFLLAFSAIILPINESLMMGPLQVEFSDTFTVLGRQFILGEQDRYLLAVIYASVGIWNGGTLLAGTDRHFIPLGFGIAASLVAAIAVQPFVYAALLIEMAVLLAIPLLIPPGRKPSQGVTRMLTIMTLGVPFLLMAGWFLSSEVYNPQIEAEVLRTNIILGFGFALMLGVFPFHSWIPMLLEEVHPYAAAFILYLLPFGVTSLGVDFLASHPEVQQTFALPAMINYFGVGMILVGGGWAAFQNHLGRLFGFMVVAQTGFLMVATALNFSAVPGEFSQGLFFGLLIPRGFSMAIWALATTVIARTHIGKPNNQIDYSVDLRYRNIQGAARSLPFAGLALFSAYFSLAGLPLLAGFPFLFGLLNRLGSTSPSILIASALFGMVGLLAGGIRALAVLVMGQQESGWVINEDMRERGLLLVGIAVLILLGIFPQWLAPIIQGLSSGR